MGACDGVRRSGAGLLRAHLALCVLMLAIAVPAAAQHVSVDTSATGRRQVIDGFGSALDQTAMAGWYQQLFFDDLGATIVRWDLSPRFVSPYSDALYYTPWFNSGIPFPGPDGNNARTYTGPADYSRPFAGFEPPIAVMGPDIDQNVLLFDVLDGQPLFAGTMGQAGVGRIEALGDVKIIATIFSPAPWLKVASGNVYTEGRGVLPAPNTPFPFVWNGNYGGGFLDISDVPLEVFHDGIEPTSALTQFARSTAAYLRAFQNEYGLEVHAVGIQNELNFEHYFYSCKYPRTEYLAAALKVLRAELDRYEDLRPIRIIGPEDLLIDTPYALWQFGGGAQLTHKNLRFLHELQSDPLAWQALDFLGVHGSVSDTTWSWWAQGWTSSPAGTLPAEVHGFTAFGKKSWMTETSGHANHWPTTLEPADQGALGLALSIHRALGTGEESAWLHWQFAHDEPAGQFTLTDESLRERSPKYVALKHFARFIRPEAQRVAVTTSDAPGLLASAYIHDADDTLTLVLINTEAAPIRVALTLPTQPAGVWSMASFTSDALALWSPDVTAVAPGRSTSVSVPGHGMVTLVGSGSERLDVAEGTYRFVNRHSGLRVDTSGSGAQRRLIQFYAHQGPSQRFLVTSAGEGTYTLRTSDGALAVTAAATGSELSLLPPAAASDLQRWSFEAASAGDVLLRNVATNLVLDVWRGTRLPGVPLVQQAARANAASQRWQLTPVP